jgi:hypothetical protein
MIRTSGFVPSTKQEVQMPDVPEKPSVKIPPISAGTRSSRRFSTKQRKAYFLYFFLVLFFIGMMYGAVFLRSGTPAFLEQLGQIHENYLFQRQEQSALMAFLTTLTSSSLFLLGSFVAGFCAIGHPVTICIPFIRGLGVGSYMGYLYLNYGLTGVAYSILLIIPGMVISMLALVLSCRESFRMSNLILWGFVKETGKINRNVLSLYLKKHLVLFLFLLVSAAVDSILNFIFAGMFSLT